MSHYSPHNSASFEGYYNRFRLPSGASVCLIVSSVPGAKERPYMISFTHVNSNGTQYWQKEYWSDKWETQRSQGDDYSIEWDQGRFEFKDEKVNWEMKTKEIEFYAKQLNRGIPWKPDNSNSTPAGILAKFPLPIQWHIHTVESDAEFSLQMTEINLPKSDLNGISKVHIEKNWAVSFPKSYIWMQVRNENKNKGLCLAGGSLIPGVQAYLVGYQGNSFISFMPPTSTSILGLSMGLYSNIISSKGIIDIDILGWFKRLKITGRCDPSTYFSFAAPLAGGHVPDYTVQSYASNITVQVYERSWPWSEWKLIEKEDFTQGGMEFGGDFYERHEE
ncbi:uncharacterized protein I206_107864 [Kwoniella pini CBS 10737]|uniref:Uncharacterized protein n=1 Tax=Kwoniella pini CBS 10737 TaxID=1296096 RepID=A0A1B9HYI4_9TREE|nr:uncharacterized protein I206_06195 [Kwoniella pini CBS 10737]OCF48327.1 hypothetical protein I206_06195 [Kwoniella pini CBS 10737]